MESNSQYGPGTGDILMDEVDCNGDETSLMDCGHDGWGVNDCDHDEDVSITCLDHLNLTGSKLILYNSLVRTSNAYIMIPLFDFDWISIR